MKNIPLLDFRMPESCKTKPFFRFAKHTAFTLVAGGLSLFASSAYAQDAKVNIQKQNVKIESILNEIESQTNYLFVYKKDVDVKPLKSIEANGQTVAEVLLKRWNCAPTRSAPS